MIVGTHAIPVDNSGTSFDGVVLGSKASAVSVSNAAVVVQGSSIIISDAIVHLSLPALAYIADSTVIAGLMMTAFDVRCTSSSFRTRCRTG